MEEAQALEQEQILRTELRNLGLGWILTQVDEALVNEAAEHAEPPGPHRRLALITEAVAFAVEVTDRAESSLLPLLAGEDAVGEDSAAERMPRQDVEVVRFIDPVAREEQREVRRDRTDRAERSRAVRDAAEQLKREIGR